MARMPLPRLSLIHICINRSGMDLLADPNLVLQVGDRVMVVGQQDAVERVAGFIPVSYTHRDVYKRQIPAGPAGRY